MLNVSMEFRRGVLFVRLDGVFNDNNIKEFENKVREVIISTGIKYVVLNTCELQEISNEAIKEIKELKKVIKKLNGEFFLYGGYLKELKKMVNLDNELKVFEKVVI